MSGPVDNTGRLFTLKPGQAAQLLTEYATGDPPLLIVNTGNARAWIGSNSSVGPGNGVPCEPGTALPWIGTGIVYAAIDSAATVSIDVYITSAISGWTPSPAGLAAEVAAELLATGVPSVILETSLINNQPVPPAGGILEVDISGAASLIITLGAGGPGGLSAIQFDPLGNAVDRESFANATSGRRWAATGTKLRFTNSDPVNAKNVSVMGSNRPALRRLDDSRNTSNGDAWSIGSTVMVAGTSYALAQGDPSASVHGQCYVYALISGASAPAGQFVAIDANGGITWIADTSEFHVSPSGGNRVCTKMVAVPIGATYTFQCRATGGTASASLQINPV